MPDISNAIKVIRSAYRGEEVRDAIIDALNIINEVDPPIRPNDLVNYLKAGNVRGSDLFDSQILPGSKASPQTKAVYELIRMIETLLDGINGEVI